MASVLVQDLCERGYDRSCGRLRIDASRCGSKARYINDKFGGASRMFGFVEFSKRSVAARVQQLLSDNLFLLSKSQFGNRLSQYFTF